jgi:hypothetical protein
MFHFPNWIYYILKTFFSSLWLIYLASLFFKWDSNLMWHITGILSIVYFIVNLTWMMSRKTPINH